MEAYYPTYGHKSSRTCAFCRPQLLREPVPTNTILWAGHLGSPSTLNLRKPPVIHPPLLLALQDAAPSVVPADTAWMLVSTALVLLMTPALAFFYGGLVRSKNAPNTMMMSFVLLGFVGGFWALVCFFLPFSTRGSGGWGVLNTVFRGGGLGTK